VLRSQHGVASWASAASVTFATRKQLHDFKVAALEAQVAEMQALAARSLQLYALSMEALYSTSRAPFSCTPAPHLQAG
jgi:hypothetical protein